MWVFSEDFKQCRNEILKALRTIEKQEPEIGKTLRKCLDMNEVKDQQLKTSVIFQSILIMVTYIKCVCVFRYKYILYCLSMSWKFSSSIFTRFVYFSKHSFSSDVEKCL